MRYILRIALSYITHMELPSPLSLMPSSLISSTSANALLKASCNEQGNLTCTSDASNHHQLMQCSHNCLIQLSNEQAAPSKKRKLANSNSNSEQEEAAAHASTIHTLMLSPQHKLMGHQYHCDVSAIKDHRILQEKEEEEEEGLVGCTTPPHMPSACNAAHDHDCNDLIREMNGNEELDADLTELDHAQPGASALIGDNVNAGESKKLGADQILLHVMMNGDGGMQESMYCGCRSRGPPPPPRKPKAKPRILKSNHLNFFVPPDLDHFFSSSTTSYKHN